MTDTPAEEPTTPFDPLDPAHYPDTPFDISEITVPRKIPPLDDIDGQVKAVTGALASAMLTATDMPIHMLIDVMGDLAKQMVAFGVRQTDQIDTDAVHAPHWITDGATARAMPVPQQINHQTAEPAVVRTAEAPNIPKRFPAGSRAVEIDVVTDL